MEGPEIFLTGDGSPTFFSSRFNENYHSRHGSLTESLHVFIRQGLEKKRSEKEGIIRVGEIGLGSGLNAALAFQFAVEKGVFVEYRAVEAYPLLPGMLSEFAQKLPFELVDFHSRLMTLPAGKIQSLENNFSFSWSAHVWPAPAVFKELDVLFYDAFSPDKQPELWTPEAFRTAFESMEPGGILVTYCAKGYVRRNMEEAGFQTERLPGPPGKREMLRARRPE
jgi:tRNA U34 5-methylaminomethyl-2-thiouridine-forming methyltransferase MnmC